MKHLFFSLTILFISVSCRHELNLCSKSDLVPPLRELSVGEKDTVVICSKDPRNRTGILLKKEGVYSFEVSPRNQHWKDAWLPAFNANGRISPHFTFVHLWKRKVNAKWFALIGSINDKKPTYFKIGKKKENYVPGVDGELVCFANDVKNEKRYDNNKGSLTLIVTRTR